MSPQIAVYPGFFDPFTRGHLNIVQRGTCLFEKIIVAVAQNSPKHSLFAPREREAMIREVFSDFSNVEVRVFEGLFVNYLKENGWRIILRGIRTVSDFEYEHQMALANRTLVPEIETVFLMTDARFSYLSSTLIKEIARLGGDINEMVPKPVARKLKEKYAT